ncbi:MAG: 3'(2'),5'-bisphosphate nucleotidase CysQ [Bosea sp. (in: a-proteobacteria)]
MTESSELNLPDLLECVRRIALEAGDIAQGHFRLGAQTSAQIWSKQGGSPVTKADIDVDAFLKSTLEAALPKAAWLSEETVDDPVRLGRELVWVVDPIDGTRAFMAGVPDWCVCVALLSNNQPVLGVVHAPALGITYEAITGKGAIANGKALKVSGRLDNARVAGPKPMLDALGAYMAFAPQPKVPSLALRLTRIADASLDGGLVLPDARDWDLAAADLILHEAGGRITNLDNARLAYNRERPVHPTLVAAGTGLHPALLAAALQLREKSFPKN